MTSTERMIAVSSMLKSAATAHLAGRLSERELLAISRVADSMLRDEDGSRVYRGFSDLAQKAIAQRLAEIDKGDA